jgi:hypothetical protein
MVSGCSFDIFKLIRNDWGGGGGGGEHNKIIFWNMALISNCCNMYIFYVGYNGKIVISTTNKVVLSCLYVERVPMLNGLC